MGRFARSFSLAKASWQVLLSEKEMVGYTALGAICTLIAAAAFAIPGFVILLAMHRPGEVKGGSIPPEGIVLLFFFYLVVSFVTLFFNTALIGAALMRFRGGQVNFSAGLQIASRNIGHIFVYAVITATVGVILELIQEKFQFVGQIVRAIVGGAWAIATFLVVPVMVAEEVNPLEAIKRSVQLLHKTWGEQIIGSGGIGLVIFLMALPAAVPVALGIVSGQGAGLIAGCVIAAIYVAVVFVVGSALNEIYRAAVYLYAQTGTTPSQFDGMLADAFRPKKAAEATGNI